MTRLSRFLSLCAFALWSGTAAAEELALEVTTDTVTYCGQLHERVEILVQAAAAAPPQQVLDLTTEGQRMCDHGLARGGIMRLRRALSIMTHPGEDN